MAEVGVEMVPVRTPSGTFRVWTRRARPDPAAASGLTVLTLHGGPGATHEYLLGLEEPLVAAGHEVVFYDQLGSHHSDQPDDASLWHIDRFTDEVEQVRQGLGLERFVLYGQSWGGMLGIEYALAHPGVLQALVVSNMMASVPAYNAYAEQVLMPAIDPDVLAEIKRLEATGQTADPAYQALLSEHFYVHHVLRRPVDQWPAPVVSAFDHINHGVYDLLNGPSELGAIGTMGDWDRFADLDRITVPTLVMGAEHDTMDPAHLRAMAERIPSGAYHHSPRGSHLALVDDRDVYLAGLLDFLGGLDAAG